MKFIIAVATIICAASFAAAQQPQYLGAPNFAPALAPPPAPPVYQAKPSYGPVHVGASVPYTYPSPAPHVPCPTNLLLSCAPSVAPVPCQSVSYEKPPPAYARPAYAQQSNFP